jgi:phytanoyl-CoA hydroxylase
MNTHISKEQINFYQTNGFIVIDNFLASNELEIWKEATTEAIAERNGQKMPGKDISIADSDGINEDAEYHSKVFDQMINLWQTNQKVKDIMLDERIGRMAAALAQVNGIRIWHDQTLFKRPWANPTSWHLDTPFWSFTDRNALSIWVALDDATLENGCLFFIPGSHLETGFENPGIGKNMDAVFNIYPSMRLRSAVAAPMKAGSCSFHNGLTIHGANANMTPTSRRAMTCAYMPDGNIYNGTENILPQQYLKGIRLGDALDNNEQNPLIYKQRIF